jgi:hypothetical protein
MIFIWIQKEMKNGQNISYLILKNEYIYFFIPTIFT